MKRVWEMDDYFPEKLRAKITYKFSNYWSDLESEIKRVLDFLNELGVYWSYSDTPPTFMVSVDRELSEEELKELEKKIKEYYKALIEKMKLIEVYK